MSILKKFAVMLLLIIFSIFPIKVLAVANSQVIENGIYEIEWRVNNNKVVDISAASKETGANVQIWDKCNGKQQRYQITYLNNGYYEIKNINSGKVLDVKGAGTTIGTNVHQWTSNSTDAQRWKIEKNADGSVSIISKCNGLYLSVTGSKNSNGANIEVNNKRQSFNLKKITTIKGSRTINDGYYYISCAIDESKVLDISAASKLSGANVQIWQNESVAQQKFYIKYDGNGYYTIKNVNSGMLQMDKLKEGTMYGNGQAIILMLKNG